LNGRHKDGSEFALSLEVELRTEGGQSLLITTITQITEQLEAQVTIDSKGIIKSLNKTMWVLFGYSEEDLLGKNIKVLMTHPHAEMHDTYLKRYLRTHKKRIIGTRRVLKAKHKDGSAFYMTLEVLEFFKNGEPMFSGKITRLLNEKEKKRAPEIRYIGNYVVTGILTDGLYGQVRTAVHQLTGEKVIIKTIEKTKIDMARFREISIMKKLRHSNVVRLLEVVEAPEKLYIVIQYIEGGELYDYAVSKDRLTEDEARVFWRQLVQGVQYMHSRGVVHRDLKLENIMLDKNKNVVIIDMGLSNEMRKDQYLSTFCGSSSYAAPEMFLCRRYKGPEVDVWSLGVILYCMVLGYLPFEDPQHIVDADYIPFEESDHVSRELQDLIAKIFRFDPQKRITMEEIRLHPWTNKGMDPLPPPEKVDHKLIDEEEQAELLKKMEDFGFDHDSVLRSLSQEDFNQITASVFLLQKNIARSKSQGPTSSGGCPFAHAASASASAPDDVGSSASASTSTGREKGKEKEVEKETPKAKERTSFN